MDRLDERSRPYEGRSGARDDDPAWWAIDAEMELESTDPVRALEIAFAIARQSSDEWVLENLGAGPLETLLSRDPTFLDAIRVEVASNPNLLEALGSVWMNDMPAETWAAVQRLTGQVRSLARRQLPVLARACRLDQAPSRYPKRRRGRAC